MHHMRSVYLWVLVLVIAITSGCTLNVTFHDEDAAAAAVGKQITAFYSDHSLESSYLATHEAFQSMVSLDNFVKAAKLFRKVNGKAPVTFSHYFIINNEDAIQVYGVSDPESVEQVHFVFTMSGSKRKGYTLYNFTMNNTPPPRLDNFFKYGSPLIVAL